MKQKTDKGLLIPLSVYENEKTEICLFFLFVHHLKLCCYYVIICDAFMYTTATTSTYDYNYNNL